MTIGQDIDRMLEKVKQQRDDLKLQAHLFKAETRDEWDKVEDQWQNFQSRAKLVGSVGSDAGEDIGEALKMLGQEMLEGYRKIRQAL